MAKRKSGDKESSIAKIDWDAVDAAAKALGMNFPRKKRDLPNKHISFLLGAGFSAPAGYPVGNQLNQNILELNSEDFCISTDGSFCWLKAGIQDPCSYSDYYIKKIFFIDFIKFYNERNDFHYEEFYDYYYSIYKEGHNDQNFETFCDDFRGKHQCGTGNPQLIGGVNSILNQVVSAFLVDVQGQQFYEPVSLGKPYHSGYTGFLNCLEAFGQDHIVNIHTLNHDIFFDRFRFSDWIQGDFSDGFEEKGSPYYGKIEHDRMVRLSHFTDRFDKRFRLFKLHGSVDQLPFHIQNNGIDNYIKTKFGVGFTEFYKEVQGENGELKYINDWINYFPDFLSGTTSKILRYREPFYDNIFKHFELNLQKSHKLIIVGYGGADEEINRMIEEIYVSEKLKPIFVVNPYPNDRVYDFCKRTRAKLIDNKEIEDLTIQDFDT